MAFWLTVAYVVLTFLSPEQLIPVLAPYRPMLILAGLAVAASIGQFMQYGTALLRVEQTYLMLGLISAVLLSHLSHLYFGGMVMSLQLFMPSAIVFFLVIFNVTTWLRLRILAFAIVFCALAMLVQGIPAYYAPYSPDEPSNAYVLHERVWDSGQLQHLERLRAVGFLNDPNDFAQFLITTLPLVLLAWRPQRKLRNFCFVLLPSGVILYGMFLTHSRGGLLGIMVLFLFLLRDRVGTIGSTVITVAAFVGLMAMQFTGDRGISMEEGSGRIEAWSAGLGMFKSSPLFGVGFNRFQDFYEITAHNSWILCLAELGLFGLFFWLALLVVSTLQLNELVDNDTYARRSQLPQDEFESSYSESRAWAYAGFSAGSGTETALAIQTANDEEESLSTDAPPDLQRWSKAIRLSLFTFMVTAWFLSRTYVVTLYLYLALTVVLMGFAEESGVQIERYRPKWGGFTAGAMFVTVILLYVIVRLHWA